MSKILHICSYCSSFKAWNATKMKTCIAWLSGVTKLSKTIKLSKKCREEKNLRGMLNKDKIQFLLLRRTIVHCFSEYFWTSDIYTWLSSVRAGLPSYYSLLDGNKGLFICSMHCYQIHFIVDNFFNTFKLLLNIYKTNPMG